MKVTKDGILDTAQKRGEIRTSDFVVPGGLSRQAIVGMISDLVEAGKLIKVGNTRSARYMTPEYLEAHPGALPERYTKTFANTNLEEHVVLQEIEQNFLPYRDLPENIKSIFAFAFSEMLNNAIDHSQSESISVTLEISDGQLEFLVDDKGIGVFRNIMIKRKLADEFEAIQDLLKGKVTTMPKLHSGEGIFFTSRIADRFELNSYGFRFGFLCPESAPERRDKFRPQRLAQSYPPGHNP
jgi:anti-sigma regulatory factor (Ser/Thr protein kinase)